MLWPPPRQLGFLGTSVCLHALLLGAAALLVFSEGRAEESDTFEVTWRATSLASLEPVEPPFEEALGEPLEQALEEPLAETAEFEPEPAELPEPELSEPAPTNEPVEDSLLATLTPTLEPAPEPVTEAVLVNEPVAESVAEPVTEAPRVVDLTSLPPVLDGAVLGSGGALARSSARASPEGTRSPVALFGSSEASGMLRAGASRTPSESASGTGARRPLTIVEPVARDTPRPGYPRLSRRAGEEGSVLCRLHVGADGRVSEVEVVESSGHERLDRAATETLVGWRFEPRREDGRPVAARILHRVTFRLSAG
ncbi:MAG: TonB family protein [Planctomycetes bacterium]|nr:TonB family protein [Planctomycetota bacterium]